MDADDDHAQIGPYRDTSRFELEQLLTECHSDHRDLYTYVIGRYSSAQLRALADYVDDPPWPTECHSDHRDLYMDLERRTAERDRARDELDRARAELDRLRETLEGHESMAREDVVRITREQLHRLESRELALETVRDRLRGTLRTIADLRCTNYPYPLACGAGCDQSEDWCGPCIASAALSLPSHDMLQSDS